MSNILSTLVQGNFAPLAPDQIIGPFEIPEGLKSTAGENGRGGYFVSLSNGEGLSQIYGFSRKVKNAITRMKKSMIAKGTFSAEKLVGTIYDVASQCNIIKVPDMTLATDETPSHQREVNGVKQYRYLLAFQGDTSFTHEEVSTLVAAAKAESFSLQNAMKFRVS